MVSDRCVVKSNQALPTTAQASQLLAFDIGILDDINCLLSILARASFLALVRYLLKDVWLVSLSAIYNVMIIMVIAGVYRLGFRI